MVFHYFMKHKSDITLATAMFIADVAHIGKIKRLWTDNGGEYMEGSFQDLLVQHSIKHERSAPSTPQQNGNAERSWRTSFDMTRCLLLDSRLPKICGHMHYQQVNIPGTAVSKNELHALRMNCLLARNQILGIWLLLDQNVLWLLINTSASLMIAHMNAHS